MNRSVCRSRRKDKYCSVRVKKNFGRLKLEEEKRAEVVKKKEEKKQEVVKKAEEEVVEKEELARLNL